MQAKKNPAFAGLFLEYVARVGLWVAPKQLLNSLIYTWPV